MKLIIGARQTGKTSRLLKEFEQRDDVALFSFNYHSLNLLKKRLSSDFSIPTNEYSFLNSHHKSSKCLTKTDMTLKKIKTVLFDEFDFSKFDIFERIYHWCLHENIEMIFSTTPSTYQSLESFMIYKIIKNCDYISPQNKENLLMNVDIDITPLISVLLHESTEIEYIGANDKMKNNPYIYPNNELRGHQFYLSEPTTTLDDLFLTGLENITTKR